MELSVRGRAGAAACLFVIAIVASCHDEALPPKRQPLLAPSAPAFDFSIAEVQTLPVNAYNANNQMLMSSQYPVATWVDITFSGFVSRTNRFDLSVLQIGPSGTWTNCAYAQVSILFDLGGSWSPPCSGGSEAIETHTFRTGVRGRGTVTRSAHPPGCTQDTLCYNFSGSQTISVVPVVGTLTETVNRPITYAGDWVTFSMYTGGIPPAYVTVLDWTWFPDVGPEVVQCPWGDWVCSIPVQVSGNMRVRAINNGVIQTAWARVVVQCMIFGPTADSAFLRIANDTLVRALAQRAWDSTGFAGPPADRRERAGYIGSLADGSRVIDFKTPTSPPDSPCRNEYAPVLPINQNAEFIRLHTHPFFVGDTLPPACWDHGRRTTSGEGFLGPSAADFKDLKGWPLGWGVVVDADYIYVFHTPPDMTFGTEIVNGQVREMITSDWRPYVRRYHRRLIGCTVL